MRIKRRAGVVSAADRAAPQPTNRLVEVDKIAAAPAAVLKMRTYPYLLLFSIHTCIIIS